MVYVVVDMSTRCRISHPRTRVSSWPTERAAKAARTRISKMIPLQGALEIMDLQTYHNQVPMVEVVSIGSGKKVMIRADERGTCTDPSMERYWTM